MPFPPSLSGVALLHTYMKETFVWIAEFRAASVEEMGCACLPPVPPIASLERHSSQAVVVLASQLRTLRNLRVVWDDIVRQFEGDWSADKAVVVRHWFASNLCLFAANAYTSPEVLEARMQKIEQALLSSQLGMPDLFGGKTIEEYYSDHEED